jgi:hypothetical protein
MNRTFRTLTTGLLLLACLAATGGCRVAKTIPLRLNYPANTTASAVDVKSFGGTVKIVCNPNATAIGIESSVRVAAWVSPKEKDAVVNGTDVIAEIKERDGRSILVVEGLTSYPDDTASELLLTITLPSVQGTRVQLVRGTTELINVEGAIQVNQVQGDIILRSNYPLRDPVLLMTGRGDINAALVPESVGELDLSSATGRVKFRAFDGVMRDMTASRQSFHGLLNDASNTIKMQADGDVTVVVRDNAGAVVNPQ